MPCCSAAWVGLEWVRGWATRRPQMDFPVQSAICTLEDVDVIKEGKDRIVGYAHSGGGRGIERVDISVDGAYSKLDSKAIGITNGVVLVTYSSLIASSEKGHSYLQQLVQWCGSEFDGLLVFDEVQNIRADEVLIC